MAAGVTADDDTEDEAENMVPIPDAEARRDAYLRAWVRRDFGCGLVLGQIEAIEMGALTHEVCYYVHYVDGGEGHLTREEVGLDFSASANASAAIWGTVDCRQQHCRLGYLNHPSLGVHLRLTHKM